MIFRLDGHIGAAAAALVDGQLPEQDAERAWRHVLGCPGCRRLVETEAWVKHRLAGLSPRSFADERDPAAVPAELLGALHDVEAWAHVDRMEHRTRRRRTAALVGAGSVGVAVAAFVALTASPVGQGVRDPEPAPAQIGGVGSGGDSSGIEPAGFDGATR